MSSKTNTSKKAKNKNKKNKKTKLKQFQDAIHNKRIMLPILAFLTVAVLTLTVLLILDATGILYATDVSDGFNKDSTSVSSSAAKPIDGELLTEGDYKYVLLTDGTAELCFYSDTYATTVTVPSEIGGYPVSSIGEECFVWMPALNEVIISEGITNIAENAFEGCSYLYTVSLPSTLKTIADNAFLDCYSILDVTFNGSASSLSVGSGNSYLKKQLS